MIVSGLTFRKTLAGTGWHWEGCFSPPMHKQTEKTAWPCLGSPLERPWLVLDGLFLTSYA